MSPYNVCPLEDTIAKIVSDPCRAAAVAVELHKMHKYGMYPALQEIILVCLSCKSQGSGGSNIHHELLQTLTTAPADTA